MILHNNLLQRGNAALSAGQTIAAMTFYCHALITMPELGQIILANISRTRAQYHFSKSTNSERLKVAVCGWELGHNAAGRVYTLAKLYQGFAKTEIIGSLFAEFGGALWEPIRESIFPCHTILIEDKSRFVEQALLFVASHPYDVVHLSKPRATNLIIGVLYKQMWGTPVIMDVDDEELAFVGAKNSYHINEFTNLYGKLPDMQELAGKVWTQISVGLASAFDGLTVANVELQKRYGGIVIGHARNECLFQPSEELSVRSRVKFGIPKDKKVVLFFGTPRMHKGLLQIAHAIAQLQRKDVVFVIVGDFPNLALKKQLFAVKGVDYFFIGNQQFEFIPEIVAIADVCVLPQNNESMTAQFQTPAKLTDALAMGIPVIVSPTPTLAPFIAAEVVISFQNRALHLVIAEVLESHELREKFKKAGREYFIRYLSFANNQPILKNVLNKVNASKGISVDLNIFIRLFRVLTYS